MNSLPILLIIHICFLFSGCFSALDSGADPDQSETTTTASDGGPLVLAHYMPWYFGPANRSEENNLPVYGGHWTGWGKTDCTQTWPDGRAKIYSHQYPLTGPYDGGAQALLEYQAALMKMAGIDGVIFDWYGSDDRNDFGDIHRNTQAMADVLSRAGLFFALCYEDNTLNMLNYGKDDPAAVTAARGVFGWARENWFTRASYVRCLGRPLVLCFGPQFFSSQSQWEAIFADITPAPYFGDLDNRSSWADVSYPWPPMGRSVNGILTVERLTEYLDSFYQGWQKDKPYRIASVFSAFDDCYEDTGDASYGDLDYADGAVFDLTFKKAQAFNPSLIQIVTWNDYGEGTIIEPTIERGYAELEYTQAARKARDCGFPFTIEDLRYPLEFYKMLYTGNATAAQKAAIAAAYTALFAGDAAGFRASALEAGVTVSTEELRPLLRG